MPGWGPQQLKSAPEEESMETLVQQVINGLVLGSLYALIALGYTMVYGVLNLINFAHGDVLMVGALAALSAVGVLHGVWPGLPGWLLLILGMAAAAPVCVSLSLVIERVAYRPLRHAPRLAPLITAIGAGLAAVAGVMIEATYQVAHFYMGFIPGLKAFTAAVLGGIGNIPGAMVGGILLGLIEALGAGYIGQLTNGIFGSNYQDVFAFIVLCTVLILRPSGLLGERVADRA